MFGFIDFDKLYSLTLRQWDNMKKGYLKKQIDEKRMNAEAGWAFAIVNNGKKLNSYLRALDVQESQIGKSQEEIKQDREVRKAVYRRQKADMVEWLDGLNTSKAEEEEAAE